MQVNLYNAILKKVVTLNERCLFLVDGTITLSVFNPSKRDSIEYRRIFDSFVQEIYLPLISNCIKKDILLIGFLKQTGSSFLSQIFRLQEIYDIYIIDSILKINGDYIPPIPIPNTRTHQLLNQNYVTFFLNLHDWNYRFELLEEQQNKYVECIENLLF